MTEAQNFRLVTLRRSDGFLAARAGDFAAGSKGLLLIGTVHQSVATADGFLTQQKTGDSGEHSGTSAKVQAYLALHEDIDAIARTAHAMADDTPGIEEKFRRPRSAGDEALKTAAKAFLKDATPLEAEFIAYELRADFLEDLTLDIAAFVAAEGAQGTSLDAQVEGTTGLDDAIMAGMAALRKLDAIIRNKYHDKPAILAAWVSASHVQRAARSKTPAAPTT